MTREEIMQTIANAIETAPKTTPRAVLDALREAGQFIEDAGKLVVGANGDVQECVGILERAAALKIGVMDSDSVRHRIEQQRADAMQEVIERLRAA